MRKTLTLVCSLLMALSAQAQTKDANKQNTATDHGFSVAKNLEIFNSLYRYLDLLYVDTLDAEQLIQTGIDAMLQSLDPYTEYYPAEDMGDLKLLTTGKYGGIGSTIRMRKDSTVIIGEPYEGMPAAEVGLKVGDVLKRIDDIDLKGKNTGEVSELLRGEPGTTFLLTIQRPGEKKTRAIKITRRNIKIDPIPYAGMVSGDVGYIALTQFTENCSAEVRKALIALKDKGARSFIIDLRGNGGGLLSEAVNIVNLFVPKGLTIVETKGKVTAANSSYATQNEPLDLTSPICVLVNANTASAAEILSGSLQDLDRAVVVGSRTFGKGLVQSPRELPYNGSLKLTTSKYYIPSGRCIQAVDYKRRRETGGDGRVPDSLAHKFRTAAGREVTDATGIIPDVEVKHDTIANIVAYLANDDALVDWGTQYAAAHPTLPPISDFRITDQDVADLLKQAQESGFTYDRQSEKRLDDLKRMAKFEGYYDDAKPEFDALEAKLTHNLERDFKRNDKDIRSIMAQEVVKRYYFQRGSVEEGLKDDTDLKEALQLLADTDRYRAILTPAAATASIASN